MTYGLMSERVACLAHLEQIGPSSQINLTLPNCVTTRGYATGHLRLVLYFKKGRFWRPGASYKFWLILVRNSQLQYLAAELHPNQMQNITEISCGAKNYDAINDSLGNVYICETCQWLTGVMELWISDR